VLCSDSSAQRASTGRIKLVNGLNESHPSLSAGGPQRSRLNGYEASSDYPTSYKCQSRNQEWKKMSEACDRRLNVGGEKIVSRLGTRRVGVRLLSNWRKQPHPKHVHTDWNPRELADSDHSPLPPPTQGRTSVAQMGWPVQTQNHHLHPLPPSCSSEFTFLLVSTYFCFSSLLSLSVAFQLFFKLVYRTRREAACGKELSLLSFDDVISVVVPQRTFFLWREKSQQFLHNFIFVLYLSLNLFLLFFVNDDKKDLPLNVQDVFSHTWTGF